MSRNRTHWWRKPPKPGKKPIVPWMHCVKGAMADRGFGILTPSLDELPGSNRTTTTGGGAEPVPRRERRNGVNRGERDPDARYRRPSPSERNPTRS